jgi:alpha-1,4-digalacturonate transport system substrate-binding protein
MKSRFLLVLVTVLALTILAMPILAQDPVELRITWYNDGNEGEVLRDLLDRYEAENPGVTVVMDTIPYADLDTTLQPQVETGNAPDLARVTDVARYKGYYLDLTPYLTDAETWASKWPEAILEWMRDGEDDNGLYGFMTQATVTGPFINRTLFEQAGVAVPSDTNDAVTWQEWVDAATQVAEAVSTPDNTVYAVAIDRSGHRVWGPALSMGATFAQFDENGNAVTDEDGDVLYTVDTPGFRQTAEMIIGWHEDGITPAEVWVGAGGSYASARDFFTNGQLVLFMSGSWQIGAFSSTIGDLFDWEAIPNPTGEGGSTGMPGGAALMAFADTEHPEEVAKLVEYLSSEEIHGEFVARSLFLTYQTDIAAAGVDFQTELPAAGQSLDTFLAQIPNLSDEAWVLQTARNSFALNTGIRERLTQVITGELTLDEAILRIQEEVDEAAQPAS